MSRGADVNYTPRHGRIASATRVGSPLRADARRAEGRGVPRVRSEVLQAQEASRTQPETPAEARQAERGRLSSGEKRKTEGRDRAAAPRPAATLPTVRHGNGLNAIWQTKCTQQSYSAFNLPLVAFSLSGDLLCWIIIQISPNTRALDAYLTATTTAWQLVSSLPLKLAHKPLDFNCQYYSSP